VAHSERAASLVIERVGREALSAREIIDPIPWAALLRALDAELAKARLGETTAVICAVNAAGHCGGASVGDSLAWAVNGSQVLDMTAKQKRKPLLGSGRADVVAFFHRLAAPRSVVVGTDGLFNYVPVPRIRERANEHADPAQLATALVELAFLAPKTLQDDVGVAVARWSE
jgi:PPM family protein phosphatase